MIRRLFPALSLILASLSLFALHPPRPGEIQALKDKGTFQERLAFAHKLGNHRLRTGEDLLRAEPLRGLPAKGTVRMVMLCVDFPDFKHKVSQASIEATLFGEGYAENYPVESLRMYYQRSSYGILDIQGDVLGWYTAQFPRDTYTDNAEMLIEEIMDHYNGLGQDFSPYDNDGDGQIDYFGVYWTGPIGEWASFWWGWNSFFGDPSYKIDGKSLGNFSWFWEPDRENADAYGMIHETGHALGLPDYYDYDDSIGPRGGLGGLDVMDGWACDHNAFSKWVLGWLTPEVSTEGAGISLQAGALVPQAVAMGDDLSPTDPFHEYFIIQNRSRIGNDTTFPGDGIMILHVDARRACGASTIYDNSYTEHKLLRLMEADGREEIESGGWAEFDDLYAAHTHASFTPVTQPNSDLYDGRASGVHVDGISSAGMIMTADIRRDGLPILASVRVTWPQDGETNVDSSSTITWDRVPTNYGYAVEIHSGVATLFRASLRKDSSSMIFPAYLANPGSSLQFWIKAKGDGLSAGTGPYTKVNLVTQCPDRMAWFAKTFFEPPCSVWFPGIAHHPTLGLTVMAGGLDTPVTQVYDGYSWSRIDTLNQPPARSFPAMAYDPVQDGIVLYGGWNYQNSESLGDTWVLDPFRKTWTRYDGEPSPPADWAGLMVTDPERNVVVLILPGETWVWNGSSWALEDAGTTPVMFYASAAWDPVGKRVLLFGGMDGYTGALSKTLYAYSEGQWTPLTTTLSPSARYLTFMATDPWSERVLLMGGDNGYEVLSDLWAWNGTQWTQLDPCAGEPPMAWPALGVFDVGRNMLFMAGDSTGISWELAPRHTVSADFTVNPDPSSVNEPVTFSPTVTGTVSRYYWIFGDGATSSEASPTHTYLERGTYMVRLLVMDGEGSHTTTRWITVSGPGHTRPFDKP
ncbi:MAG TPA: M6 family metalloprotease domain-containing protein [Thermoanaerobaculia bacterium]|nr:M6 family metalloprotease domain-containing protein [Thermoanaerobaculia bacterium]HUM30196.1 M6 family metalloprotease domain-containing protein [Thermoanaerobaculia bacterium]HXK68355.1 M6 family metalloprotease domain-containing protein [Thermoanaerobaculia bacterium]